MRLRLTIKTALAGAFGLMALIAACQGGLSLAEMASIRSRVNEVATNWLPSVVAINGVKAAVAEMRVKQLRMIGLSRTPEELAKHEAQLGEAVASVEAAVKIYEPLIASPEERTIFSAFATLRTGYDHVNDAAREQARAGKMAEAAALIAKPESVEAFNAMRKALDRSAAYNEKSAQKDADAAVAAADTAATTAIAAVLLAVLAALGAATFGLLGISRPITRMTAAMSRLAEGDTATEVPYAARRDEIGAMASAVQVFKDNMVRTRALEEETALARAGAEAQRKRAMHEMADGFERAVGGIVGTVTAAATELQATAATMTATASETASQSTTVAAAAEEAAGNVHTVAAAAEELGSSVQEIGRQVDSSASLAARAVAEAGQTAGLVRDLSAAAARIGDAVAMISQIAGQTNLLALNATIEAARAGEAGRGFAVVAAEVKELANQTARATEEIGSLISGIQGSTEQAVAAISGIGARIGEISGVATSIAAAVEQQGAATQEIVRNVAQAATGTGEVTANITGVARAAEDTGAAATQVLASASDLSRQSEHLGAEVGRFLASVRAA